MTLYTVSSCTVSPQNEFLNVLATKINGQKTWEQMNSFSPVWTLVCIFNFDFLANDLEHWVQWWGLICLVFTSNCGSVRLELVFSKASTASSNLSRIWKIPICSFSCFATPSDSSKAFASVAECRTCSASKGQVLLLPLSHLETWKNIRFSKQAYATYI